MTKLLIVEDDIALRAQIVFALEEEYDIKGAHNRKEAEEILKNEDFELALIDLGLPPLEQSSLEGEKLALNITQNFDTKVIVLTGQNSKDTAKNLVKIGVFDYLLKPSSMEDIKKSLKRAEFFYEKESELKKEGLRQISVKTDLNSGFKQVGDEAQKQFLLKVLKETDFNIYKSAKILGVNRENIYYFIKKFGIRR